MAYDVVVVGAGSAGCVVAARLAESRSRSVLLLEAGPDLRSSTPDALRDAWTIERGLPNWGYTFEGENKPLLRGRLVGGTSWLTRFAMRGHPADYDEWAALGNPGWAFDDILPYLSRLESDVDFGSAPWHGDSGPIPVTRYLDADYTEVVGAATRLVAQSGIAEIDDHNRPGSVGIGRMPMTSVGGHRVTTADAYLPRGSTPANLEIRAETHVDAVVFEGDRAVGVRLADGTVIESDRVVLSAGVYGSPAILLRSGIGPPEDLQAFDIPVRAALRGVGANLIDHPSTFIDVGTLGASRTAPLLHSVATFHSSGRSSDAAPDLFMWIADPEGDPPLFAIEVVLLIADARGSVRLRTADPLEPPRITPPALSEASDVERLREGLIRALEIAHGVQDECDDALPLPSGDEVDGALRANHYSIPHVLGTCAMGARPDDGAVVNTSGRVHGTERLWVIDASVFPAPMSAFTQVPTIAVAERLAEQIAGSVG